MPAGSGWAVPEAVRGRLCLGLLGLGSHDCLLGSCLPRLRSRCARGRDGRFGTTRGRGQSLRGWRTCNRSPTFTPTCVPLFKISVPPAASATRPSISNFFEGRQPAFWSSSLARVLTAWVTASPRMVPAKLLLVISYIPPAASPPPPPCAEQRGSRTGGFSLAAGDREDFGRIGADHPGAKDDDRFALSPGDPADAKTPAEPPHHSPTYVGRLVVPPKLGDATDNDGIHS